jgi:hypothetical protein
MSSAIAARSTAVDFGVFPHAHAPPAHPPLTALQIHLTPSGASDSVAVDFVTFSGQPTSCKYGVDASLANTVAAVSQSVTLNGWKAVMNQAEMTGLTAATSYLYQCGSTADGFSKVYNYTHAPARQRYAVREGGRLPSPEPA